MAHVRPAAEQAPAPPASVSRRVSTPVDGGGVAGGVAVCGRVHVASGSRSAGARSGSRRCGGRRAVSSASASSSRSRSLLVVPRPDRRPQPRPARDVAHDTPCSASRARSAGGSALGKDTSVVCAARRRLAPALGKQLGQARGQRARALVHGGPAGRLEHPDGRQRAGDRLGAQRQRVEAPRVLVQPGRPDPRPGRPGWRSRAARPPAARAGRG